MDEILVIMLVIVFILFVIMAMTEFFEKKVKESNLDFSKELKSETISCKTCKCLVEKDNAYEVKVSVDIYNLGNYDRYYCQKCKPNYSSISFKGTDNNKKFYRKLEVDEDGEPVGYKKIK